MLPRFLQYVDRTGKTRRFDAQRVTAVRINDAERDGMPADLVAKLREILREWARLRNEV